MGCLYRGKGRSIWMMRFLGADGRFIDETTGTDDRKEAEQLLRDRETALHRGAQIVGGVGKLTFDDAEKAIKADYAANGRQLRAVERSLTNLRPFFRGRKMTSITTADIRAYIRWRQAPRCSACPFTADPGDESESCPRCGEPMRPGQAPGYINVQLAALKRMFNLAIEDGRLLHAPYFPMLTLNNTRTGFFEREMFDAVHAALPEAEADIATFAYYTGWRVDSEVLPLTWDQIDFAAGVVRLEVGFTKNKDGRIFPFGVHSELSAMLRRRERARPAKCRWVFWRPNGKRLKNYIIGWRRAVLTTPWPTLIPHDFRRTAVRNLTRAGVPERVAMQLTGHKTRSVFDRYHIVNEADLREAVARYAKPAPQPAARGKVLRGAGFGRTS